MTVTVRPTPLSGPVSERSGTTMGLGCIGLFLLPFAAVGVYSVGTGVLRVIAGSWREGLTTMLFGTAFAGFAGAFGAVVLLGLKKHRELTALKEKHPEHPWLWRPDWAAGRIADNTRYTGWVAWIFAIMWNLISVPIAFAAMQEAIRESKPMLYLALLFPAIGAGLLVWAVRATLRYRRYGSSRFELTTKPGVIGRSLAGTVRLNGLVRPPDGFEVVLSCVRRITTRSGKNSSTTEHILWQEEKRVGGDMSRDAAGMATLIPIAFRIPADALPSEASDPRNQVVWRLTLSADVPGVDYGAAFEVPVFRTPDSDLPPTEEELRAASEAAHATAQYRQPLDSKITVTSNRRGTEIYFPAARNPGAAVAASVFTVLWTGVLLGLIYGGAPLVFPLVFGLFDLLLIMGTVQLWFGVSRVTADNGTLVVADGYFYPARERTVPIADVTDVTTRIGMQWGTRPYYDVVVSRKNGKPLITGRGIRDKQEANWLAFTLRAAVGLRAAPDGAAR
ncbi:MAG TPA: hypothetical protein VHH32_07615 [Gemmatimonadales bacterium]|nr:hypothetical protein [Gemmatimonadales bacterium]